jgi:hypothetical protein
MENEKETIITEDNPRGHMCSSKIGTHEEWGNAFDAFWRKRGMETSYDSRLGLRKIKNDE